MSRSPVAVSTAPVPKNSRLLNTEWLNTWNSAAVSAERRGRRELVGTEGQRQAEADEDDADVLDRVIGEQALQIVLHQRIQHAEHGGDAADRQHHGAGPPCRRTEQIEHDAHEAVHRDLGHHPAHQRRHMARRGGMRERQPGVQRHDAGLRSGADQRKHQGECGDARCRVRGTHRVEAVAAGWSGQQAEAQQQGEAGEACHDDVDVAGVRIAGFAMVRHHQRPGGERHQLPGEQEAERVVGDNHQVQPGEERRIERQHALRLVFVPAVAQRVEAGAGAARVRPRPGRMRRVDRGGNGRPSRAGRAGVSRPTARRRARTEPPAAMPPKWRARRRRRCAGLTVTTRRTRRPQRGRAGARCR